GAGPSGGGPSGPGSGGPGSSGPSEPSLGPAHSDPVGRRLINDNPNSQGTSEMRIHAGGDYSLENLNNLLDGADQAAQSAYDNARGAGLDDQAANQASRDAWQNYVNQNAGQRSPLGNSVVPPNNAAPSMGSDSTISPTAPTVDGIA